MMGPKATVVGGYGRGRWLGDETEDDVVGVGLARNAGDVVGVSGGDGAAPMARLRGAPAGARALLKAHCAPLWGSRC